MRETSSAGAVFIKEGIILPEKVPIKSEPYSKGWRLTTDVAGCDLDRKVSEAGWTLFFMAGEITATVFGSDSERSTRKAVTKLLRANPMDSIAWKSRKLVANTSWDCLV